MKKLITIIFLICCINASCQKYVVQKLPVGLMFLSGASKGTADYLQFHYNGNNQFLNPDLSWHNKWKNGDPAQGEKFPGSSTVFVGITDGWHLCNTINRTAIIGVVCLKLGNNKQPLKYYLYDFLTYSVAYSARFWATYEIIYR